ncbi:MAG: hypothetical protein UV89_C0007G0002 [candidate division WWE3 bacterium GW2011_GWB2_43_22]|uniref:Uncharacterized protein n=1 Tax=candidate division WWE3 bacterium GW2011_GWB2_43_22 TaxID=1619118 RepID=A0A0G1GX99_UNCKA|nr:MAG: hypothetical protein UV89_C0007G0002 [candidate division WWE3 bacterium GW2011_GWB2_43_22]
MEDDLKAIHRNLEKLQKEADEKEALENRKKVLALIRLITNTVNTMAPGKIEAIRYGSETNPRVTDYPVVKITAVVSKTYLEICTWTINSSGQTEPPTLTVADITKTVVEGLEKIRFR